MQSIARSKTVLVLSVAGNVCMITTQFPMAGGFVSVSEYPGALTVVQEHHLCVEEGKPGNLIFYSSCISAFGQEYFGVISRSSQCQEVPNGDPGRGGPWVHPDPVW